MRTARSGLTLVELVIVVLLVGILGRIAIPSYQTFVYRARAAQALGDLNTVRLAAYEYNVDTNAWPADQNPGEVPPELVPYLSPEFTFDRDHYRLDWENWVMPDGTPKHPDTGVLLGVSITTEDEQLGGALEKLVGSEAAHWTLADNYTFIIASAN
ncbi:MAG: hypothetical protein R3314_05940 [Longimicrobiales bacterium]|nr:hypothetical protein [Longimicrobiales bacterium]